MPLGFTGPSGVLPTESQEDSHFVPVEDRWRMGFPEWDRYGKGHPPVDDYPYVEGHWWDPFNQNVLKGDYPIIGQHTFLNITATSGCLFCGGGFTCAEIRVVGYRIDARQRTYRAVLSGRAVLRNEQQGFAQSGHIAVDLGPDRNPRYLIKPPFVKLKLPPRVAPYQAVIVPIYKSDEEQTRVLEKCRFQREGLLRKHHFKDHRFIDAYAYGLLREE